MILTLAFLALGGLAWWYWPVIKAKFDEMVPVV